VQTLVGIFSSPRAAEEAAKGILAVGVPAEQLTFLCCQPPEEKIESIPTTDAEQPGMGKALSTYLGGVIGAGVGLGVGSAVASLVLPGVGPVLAVGFGAAAALGVGGAAVGSKLGEESEEMLDQGVPRDDVLFYRELLKQGRSLVIASADSDEMATAIRLVLRRHGAHDVDGTRREWEFRRKQAA
jgi:hypothetical protein